MAFDYDRAFSRNLGWVTKEEQKTLSKKVVAIPGMGGVGGHYLHAMARLGVQHFKIADFDTYDVHNFNRQIGAMMSTVDENKTEVMAKMIRDINPNATIEIFESGIQEDNVNKFLEGVDLVLDGLDVLAVKVRLYLFQKAHDLNIPVVTAAPLGTGTSVLAFNKSMSFNEYFDISKNESETNILIKFIAGVAPKALHIKYLVAPDEVDIKNQKFPSLNTGCTSATAAITTVAFKILLGRGDIIWAPRGFHVDFYVNKYKKFWRPWGNKNPIQKLLIKIIERKFL